MYNASIATETVMHKIHYDQVGSLTWCEQYRDTLDALMEKALEGDKGAELIVVNCAAHFYGLMVSDFNGSIVALCQAINDVDYGQAAK